MTGSYVSASMKLAWALPVSTARSSTIRAAPMFPWPSRALARASNLAASGPPCASAAAACSVVAVSAACVIGAIWVFVAAICAPTGRPLAVWGAGPRPPAPLFTRLSRLCCRALRRRRRLLDLRPRGPLLARRRHLCPHPPPRPSPPPRQCLGPVVLLLQRLSQLRL